MKEIAGNELGKSVEFEVIRYRDSQVERTALPVVSEVPCTIVCNDVEIATLLATPDQLRELAAGFLFSSSMVKNVGWIQDIVVDRVRWTVNCTLTHTPDPTMLTKRMYTSGCGKGVVYSSVDELSSRRAVVSDLVVCAQRIVELSKWLQRCSDLYRLTSGTHTAGLSESGEDPLLTADDIGRHNAVDKVIGAHFLQGKNFSRTVLVISGRTSSEILHKATRAGIALIISRGVPTHQAVLRARSHGITLIGAARAGAFSVYSHSERISF